MNVPVVMVAGTIVGTKLIVEEATAVFKRMNNIVFEEEREDTKNARLVHVRHCRLQRGKAHGTLFFFELFQHKNSVGCCSDTFMF